MVEFIRRISDGRILRADSPEASGLVAGREAGPTATFGVVEFLREWTDPDTGRHYRAGDFEKFDAAGGVLSRLTGAGIARIP